jgi:flavodoxin
MLGGKEMKKLLCALLLLPIMLLGAGCGGTQTAPAKEAAPKAVSSAPSTAGGLDSLKGKKVLVAYFSYSGNTRKLATTIHDKVGGDMFEIVPAKAYPSSYDSCVELAKQEKAEKVRPALKNKVSNLSQYDVIFLGFPVWWYTLPMPVYTFLEGQDFSGKVIVPFMTHGGGGQYNCFSDVAKAAPKAKVLDGLCVSGGMAGSAGSDVDNWLKALKF